MPIHDWKPVDANLFHDFHQTWVVSICKALNSGLLPMRYSALVERHAAGLVPDVLALQRHGRSNKAAEPVGGVLACTPPKTRHVIELKEQTLAARANRIAIRHRLGEVVCIIEIVSPGNKASRSALRSFVEKSFEFLSKGVNLLVIDLFPPTPRDPQGIHKAIFDELEEQPFELAPDKPLTLAAYVAADLLVGAPTTAYVEPVGVADTLPDMPAYLERRHWTPVPLEATYQSAYASCPEDMRILVETGRLPGEEE